MLILGPKLQKEFRKKDIKTVFTAGANLKSILRQNKPKIVPNSCPGLYALNCSCNAEYIGKTKKKVMTRTIEHQQDSIKGEWEESSCATKHCLNAMVNLIGYTECASSKLNINRDDGNFGKTNTWTPLL